MLNVKTKYLLYLLLPFVFVSGCINGQAVLSINKDGSGRVSVEGLFDYPAYCFQTTTDCAAAERFFIEQLKTMISSGGFEVWSDVKWKILDDGRCYFKGTAYFKDINKIDFFIGSAKTGLKLALNRRQDEKPTVELKLQDNFRLDPQIRKLPSALFETFSLNLVMTVPAELEKSENFQRLDKQTVMFVFSGGRWLTYLGDNTVKATLASDGNDLFDYKSQVDNARKDYEKILKSIDLAQETSYAAKDANSVSAESLKDFNARLREGLAAEADDDFEKAVKIYEYVVRDSNAGEKFRAGASYQIGVCLFQMGRSEQAIKQFEYVINNYPLQGASVLKSVKMLQDIRSGEAYKKVKEEKPEVFVVRTSPGLYAEDVDPNTELITIAFSEPMKNAEWFYSSFAPAYLPKATGRPEFDSAGVEWALPVKLQAGKIYAIAVNCGDAAKNIKDLQLGFQSLSGQMCEKFVLVFATSPADVNDEPILINAHFIERCEKINSETTK